MIESGTFLQQRYRIDKQIGQGGMGAVYVATDERFGSTVAIKETLCMDDNFRKAIEREARLLNSLKHSALPRVSDHFEESNSQFLVMEYIPGDDVATMIENEHVTFEVDQVMKWADQLLDALDYLHNQVVPVIHRDIKPQNLKLNSRGEMILLDFGLAKGNPTDAGHQTAAKSIFGYSRNYASLEQIQGTGTDPRSDLYSLAATIYHLLTSVPPEDALTRAMAVLSRNADPLLPASVVDPKIPKGIAGVLQKALDLNASERPASAAQMRQMLHESEKYAYLAEAADSADTIADPQVFAQATQLMSDDTKAGGIRSTEMKTEVLPTEHSELTAVENLAPANVTRAAAANLTSAVPPARRRFGAAIGALVLLLVGGAVAGGLFLTNPTLFGVSQQKEDPSEPVSAPVTAANTGADSGSEATSLSAGTPDASGRDENPGKAAEPLNEKTSAPAKESQSSPNSRSVPKAESGDIVEFSSDDPDIPPGGVVIKQQDENGKVTTLKVNPGIQPPNVRNPSGTNPIFPNGFDPQNLTPEQRRKLQKVIRMRPRPPGMPQDQP